MLEELPALRRKILRQKLQQEATRAEQARRHAQLNCEIAGAVTETAHDLVEEVRQTREQAQRLRQQGRLKDAHQDK